MGCGVAFRLELVGFVCRPLIYRHMSRPRSEYSSGLDQFRTGPAKIRILIEAGPDQNPLISNDK